MPTALVNVDWDLAQVLFAQGVRYSEIAPRAGVTPATLRQHAHRHQWRKLRDEANTPQSIVASNATKPATTPLAERSRGIRERLAEELERQIQVLSECPPTSLKELASGNQGRTALAKMLTEAAEKLFAWRPEVPSQLIEVGDVEHLQVNLGQQPGPELPAVSNPSVQPALPESVPVSGSEPVSDPPGVPESP